MTIDELRRTATLLATLAEVEHADAVGDSREVGRLLAGVDPVEARILVNRLSFEAAIKSLAQREVVLEDVLSIGSRRVW